MNTQNNPLRTYCRRVSRLLPWGGRQKRALLAQLRQELTAFLREHPEAGEAELTARFGKPEDLAASYVENAGTKKVLTALRTRRRVCATLLAAGLALVLLFAGYTLGVRNAFAQYRQLFEDAATVSVSSDAPVSIPAGGNK